MPKGTGIAAGLTAVVVLFAWAGSASAAVIKVDTTEDEFGGAGGTGCALREAVQSANKDRNFGGCKRKGDGRADVVAIEGGSFYTDERAGVDDSNENGDLDVKGKTTVRVGGQGRATLDGNSLERVIDVRPGARLTASQLTIQNGQIPAPGPLEVGGGVRNQGTLELRKSDVRDNDLPNDLNTSGAGIGANGAARRTTLNGVLVGFNTAPIAQGGGITVFEGKLELKRSSIVDNVAGGSAGLNLVSPKPARIANSTISGNTGTGESTGGGGIFASAGAKVTATNVTISGNSSNTRGGGIFQFGGSMTLNGATVTDNTADANMNEGGTLGGSGGGILSFGEANFKNSIVALNEATTVGTDDCDGADTIEGNLVGVDGGCFGGGTNLATPDPKLGPLAANGGVTQTHEVLADSEAIGLARKRSAPPRDQRGVKRDKDPDSGAYER